MVLNAIGRGVAGRPRSLPWLCHVRVRRVTRSVLHGTDHRGALRMGLPARPSVCLCGVNLEVFLP